MTQGHGMSSDEAKPRTVVRDAAGYVYPLGAMIGRGGQGVVHESVHGWMAVKRFTRTTGRSPEELQQRIASVRRLPLEHLAIARPLSVLVAPDSGYVMRLLTGMDPIRRLIRPPAGETRVREWYQELGGLRRRLRLLGRLASTFAELHALGLTYGDPSPTNLLVSADVAASEVRLIDADNLRVVNPSSTARIFTPGYGAPELLQEAAGNTVASDVWAFAVVAFEVLTLQHPFIGAEVDEGEPELEDAAHRGELPWIDDPDDPGNRAAPGQGLPRAVVLSPVLRRLFQQCFGPGRLAPEARPSAAEFAVAFRNAESMTLRCRRCSGGAPTTYYVSGTACPWCGQRRPPVVLARVGRWDPEAEVPLEGAYGPTRLQVLEEGEDGSITLGPVQVATMAMGEPAATSILLVRLTGSGVEVRSRDGHSYDVRAPDGLTVQPLKPGGVRLPLPQEGDASWRVHADALERPHPFLSLTYVAGGHGAH